MTVSHLRYPLLAALAVLLLATAAGSPSHVAAASEPGDSETITTVLYPGWNMVGWLGPDIPVTELFDAIPELVRVSAWDTTEQRYQRRTRNSIPRFGLRQVTRGMGLWFQLDADGPVAWERPVAGDSLLLTLQTGRNLVGWAGEDGASVSDVVARFGDAFTEALAWDAATQRFMRHRPGASTTHGLASLDRGDALRVGLTEDTRWWERGTAQPTFVFADDITAEQREEVRALFESAIDVIAVRFGAHTTDFTVNVSTENIVCAARPRRIDFPFHACRLGAPHEYFHILQFELMGGVGPRRAGLDGRRLFRVRSTCV